MRRRGRSRAGGIHGPLGRDAGGGDFNHRPGRRLGEHQVDGLVDRAPGELGAASGRFSHVVALWPQRGAATLVPAEAGIASAVTSRGAGVSTVA